MSDFKEKLIRLAYEKKELRPYLLPLIKEAGDTFKCPECGTKVLEQTGYCVKCKKKVKKGLSEAQESKRSTQQDVQALKTALERWLRRKTGGGRIDDITEYQNTLWGTYRSGNIPKEYEDQDEYEVGGVLARDKKELLRALSPYDRLIKNVFLYLGDKNWVEVEVEVK